MKKMAMGMKDKSQKVHSFSIELTSRSHMDIISVSNELKNEVMLEGSLGKLIHIELVEGITFQITGDNGVIRIDLTEKELLYGLSKRNSF